MSEKRVKPETVSENAGAADGVPAWVDKMPEGYRISEFGKRASLGENMNIRIGGAFVQEKNGQKKYYFPQAQFTYFPPGKSKPEVLLRISLPAFVSLVNFAVSISEDLKKLLVLHGESRNAGVVEVLF